MVFLNIQLLSLPPTQATFYGVTFICLFAFFLILHQFFILSHLLTLSLVYNKYWAIKYLLVALQFTRTKTKQLCW